MKLNNLILLILFLILNYCTNDRQIFSTGNNDRGQLGIGNTTNVNFPSEIISTEFSGEKIVHMESSGNVKLMLTDSNKLYSWGDDSNSGVRNFKKKNCSN